jgi:membrane protein DedA with SNARE-associated domain
MVESESTGPIVSLAVTSIGLIVWLAITVYVAVRIVKRQDLGVGGKVLWIAAIVVFPLAAVIAYVTWAVVRRRRDPRAAW